MNCNDVQHLIHAFIDNELDAVKSFEIEKHLSECSSCLNIYKNYTTIHTALKDDEFYFDAPENLLKKINSSLINSNVKRPVYIRRNFFNRQNIALGIAAIVIIFLSAVIVRNNELNNNYLEEAILSNHLRSLVLNSNNGKVNSDLNMTSHLTDVTSTDEHTVKPWFDGKLDFSPPVIDLKDKGFSLIGGRLDYIKNQPAAALVYRYKKHIINMFITLSSKNLNTSSGVTVLNGFNLIHWEKSGMDFWAISDLSIDQLQIFSDLIKDAI